MKGCLEGSLSGPAIEELIALGKSFENLEADGVRRLLSLARGTQASLMIDNDLYSRSRRR